MSQVKSARERDAPCSSNTIGAGMTQSVTRARRARPRSRLSPAARRCRSASNGTQVGTIAKLRYAIIYKFNPPST